MRSIAIFGSDLCHHKWVWRWAVTSEGKDVAYKKCVKCGAETDG